MVDLIEDQNDQEEIDDEKKNVDPHSSSHHPHVDDHDFLSHLEDHFL